MAAGRRPSDALTSVDGMSRAGFTADLRAQRAVVMSPMILGDAATRVVADDPALAEDHPDIPRNAIRGMRNRIAHGYFDIDLAVVWNTVATDLPSLLDHVRAASKSLRP